MRRELVYKRNLSITMNGIHANTSLANKPSTEYVSNTYATVILPLKSAHSVYSQARYFEENAPFA